MDNVLCSDVYKKFRDSLQVNITDAGSMTELIGEAIPPVAQVLNVGKVEAKIMAPPSALTKNGFNGSIGIYEDKDGFEIAALIETFRTGENGLATISFHPRKKHKFTESEIQGVKLLANDIFLHVGRARLMGLARQASLTDTMTGAPNTIKLSNHIVDLKVSQKLSEFAGIFANIKNFKFINKSLTPAVGDKALITYVKTIQESLEEDEFIARLGGDNFFFLIRKDNLENFIERYSSIKASISLGEKTVLFELNSRMGIYQIKETDTMSEIMVNSSIALSVARNTLGGDITYFNQEMHDKALHEKEISSIFQKALSNNEFVVYYQPKVNLQTQELKGCEALVRWVRNGKIIPPSDFIPVLEKEATICQLDFLVFETVCQNIREWLDAGIEPVRISSNFSKLHLRNKNLADQIIDLMKKYKVDSRYVEIELTEVSDFEDNQTMQQFVNKLRDRGISVSIDDFGTGYSTLGVLKDLNVNVIKLDKSLLDHIGEEDKRQHEVVVKNMVSMMNELNMEVVAEGVENDKQIDFLKNINCSLVQGFIYDKPLPHDEFEQRLTQKRVY